MAEAQAPATPVSAASVTQDASGSQCFTPLLLTQPAQVSLLTNGDMVTKDTSASGSGYIGVRKAGEYKSVGHHGGRAGLQVLLDPHNKISDIEPFQSLYFYAKLTLHHGEDNSHDVFLTPGENLSLSKGADVVYYATVTRHGMPAQLLCLNTAKGSLQTVEC